MFNQNKYIIYQLSHKMSHINRFFFVYTSLKNITVTTAMLTFFALYKQKIIDLGRTSFQYPIRHFITKLVLLIILIVSAIAATAQRDTSLTREVEVTKAFKPTISDAHKINEMPKIDETEHQQPKFDYSIYSQPILSTFSVNPLKAATIDNAQKKETGYGLIRAGVGNYNKPYGEFFFNNLNSKNSVFGIHAKHLSSHGKITLEGGDKVDAPFSKNEAEIYYKHNIAFGLNKYRTNNYFI